MRNALVTLSCFMLLSTLACKKAKRKIRLSDGPVWQYGLGKYPTGIGWTDFNGDGWIDLALSNGVDVVLAANEIFYNGPDGLDTIPDWTSEDIRPSSLLSIGDLNNDGLMDLVVGNLGLNPEFKPDRSVIYLNEGKALCRTPAWVSNEVNAFSCAVGDPDGDGDLDIAFAQGIALTEDSQPIAVYLNHEGRFHPTPDWESDDRYFGVDVAFVDIDMDGDHDLAAGGKNMGLVVFYNHGGELETTPSWATDGIVGGRQIAFGDVDGDGDPDCAVAGINESFFLFMNENGTLENEPSWSFGDFKEPSCVAFGDADDDGDLDLAVSGWFYPVGVFENVNGTFADSFAWSDTVPGWGTQVRWADFDQDGLNHTHQEFKSDGARNLFNLKHRPIHSLGSVAVGGEVLEFGDYCYDPVEAWISLKNAPGPGEKIRIEYTYSVDLDLTITSQVASIFENLLRE